MVRRATLVYELLRSAGPRDEFSPKEILDRVSHAHNISPGKALKKQINVALRRGVDFGILAKQNNRYRFDLDSSSVPVANVVEKGKKRRNRRKKKAGKKAKSSSKAHHRRISIRKPSHEPPPRPRVLPPPNWGPKKRNLREEPIPKVIRHPQNPSHPL